MEKSILEINDSSRATGQGALSVCNFTKTLSQVIWKNFPKFLCAVTEKAK